MDYPPEAKFVHTIQRGYFEGERLKRLLKQTANISATHSNLFEKLEAWLLTWKDIGYMLRISGFDYIMAEHKFNPGPEPKNLIGSLKRSYEANLTLLDLFGDLPDVGEPGNDKISQCIEKLEQLQTSIKSIIDQDTNID